MKTKFCKEEISCNKARLMNITVALFLHICNLRNGVLVQSSVPTEGSA